MTTGGASEIPPLDNSPDISRSAQPQPGEVLADSSNWAGFALLSFGALAAIVAAAAFWAVYPGLGLIATVLSVVALFTGAALILVERRRRGTILTRDDEPIIWRPAGPPRY